MNTTPADIWRKNKDLSKYLGLRGKLLVWTTIHTPPLGFEHQVPYVVGVVELENGERLSVEVADCTEDDLKLNQKVITVIRRIGQATPDGLIHYGIKVKPV